ncbi:MAG: ABC transporter permease [Clostridiaceae bacterium]|jgi:putative ABC transport system permease protein|nr:ABC transporter permease [Clostridiaceae bacterium]
MFKETLIMAFKNLRSNALRTALSILGILIGIASIIALMTLGQGVSTSVTDQLSGLGGNKIVVRIRNYTVKSSFTDEDIEEFAQIKDVAAVSPLLVSTATIISNDDRAAKTNGYVSSSKKALRGTSSYFFHAEAQIKLRYGRGFTASDVESKMNYCILGASLAEEIFGNTNPKEAVIFINGYEFRVIDVLEPISGVNLAYNSTVFVPYTVARDQMLMGEITTLELIVSSADAVDGVYSNTQKAMLEMFNSNSSYFSIENQKAIMDTVITISTLIIGMLGGIAGIALLVGGIGIMNIMLVSVRERTNEIGLRLALGARPVYIMLQFMVEAVIISLLGGLAGVILGVFIAYVACNIIGAVFALSVSTIFLAVAFSIAIGLLFGILPARKASRLDPIEALRAS